MKQLLLILTLLLLSMLTLSAQDGKEYLAGIGIGSSIMRSDLQPSYKKPGIAFSGFFRFNTKKRLNAAITLQYGQVSAEDPSVKFINDDEITINSYARTPYFAIAVNPIFNIIKEESYALYVAQGFGIFHFNAYDEDNENLNNKLNSRATGESYGNTTVYLPTSLGAYYILPNDFGFGLNFQFMNPQTDYLDNISTFGNSDNNDNIIRLSLSVFKKIKVSPREDLPNN
jgi:hypothetical protein